MSTLLSARELAKAFASHTLFEGVGVQLAEGDRLGIVGPNGTGKSTLLKIMAGLDAPDSGEVIRRRGLRAEYIAQHDRFEEGQTPRTVLIAKAEQATTGDRLDPETRAAIILSKLGFAEADLDRPASELSGGWRKRLAIAAALVSEPDLLLLDEPTNHLDLEGIVWLERFITQSRAAAAFITHDRTFLENAAQRVVELSPAYPGGVFEVKGNYSEFVRRKDAFLEAQASAQATLANAVRRDTAWLRQGVQARRTRNQSQVTAATERRAELKSISDRNDAPSRTTVIDFQATERQTKKLLTLRRVSKAMGGKPLFASLDLVLSPGQRVGLLGPNGSGKTTLLRLMSGALQPDSGTVERAEALRIVTFSQHRCALDAEQTLEEALCPVGEMVDYRGKPIHVSGWARKFLFTTNQLKTPVGTLSGGEQARVLLAQLMLEPADLLLLDEPTNDLDIPSLEVLEQALLEFPGAIVLITHDRFMLERVSTEFLALDGRGNAKVFASLDQWQQASERQRAQEAKAATAASARPAASSTPSAAKPASGKPKKLTFKQQREMEGMEAAILAAEAEAARLEAQAADPKVIADHVRMADTCQQLDEAHRAVKHLYERWAELEAMQSP